MSTFRLPVAADGSMTLPDELRHRVGIDNGGDLVIHDEDGRLYLETLDDAVARAQALVREYVVPGVSMVDELIAERRAEAARE